MLKFDADLYRIAAMCQSREETRYYLQGVFVEPHAVKGVTLTTTDGHKLICIYDENGEADELAIIALSPEALKACTPKRDTRRVTVDGLSATVYSVDERGDTPVATPIAISATCRVDGTFPDYRRVVPAYEARESNRAGWYASNNVTVFCDAAVALEKHFDRHNRETQGVFRVLGDANAPGIVLFGKVAEAFGVLMPVRGEATETTPAWYGARAAVKEAAA